jgi:putative nucleotidyltransferase with HDIG domain
MQAVTDYLKKMRHLPPTPKVVPELMRLLNQPDVDSSKIVNMISFDPGLTANVLRVSNSAFFGASTPSADVQEAVTRMGFQQVYQLVAAATGARLLGSPQEAYGLAQGELWKHSVTAAIAGQLVARKIGENENLVFTAALLHDIGKTILSQALNGAYEKIVKETEASGLSLLDAEKKALGTNHAELGGQLLEYWKFPPNIVAAVWFHHAPKGAMAHQKLASCVYLGNMISNYMGHAYGHSAFALRARGEVMATLDLTPQTIPELMVETFAQMELIDTLFALAA